MTEHGGNAPHVRTTPAPTRRITLRTQRVRDLQAQAGHLDQRPPFVWVIIAAACTVVALVTLSDDYSNRAALLLGWGATQQSLMRQGEWWRAFSTAFLHANFGHLIANLIVLLRLGAPAELIYGSPRFLVI